MTIATDYVTVYELVHSHLIFPSEFAISKQISQKQSISGYAPRQS